MSTEITIIGAGRASWTFASGLSRSQGFSVRIGARTHPPPFEDLGVPLCSLDDALTEGTSLVLLAVPDDAIGSVWSSVCGSTGSSVIPFHASGSLSSDLFGDVESFSLHPLAALPVPGDRVDLSETLFTWEGAAATREVASRIVEALGGRFNAIATEEKIRYHAAAVFGSNYVATLLDVASGLMRDSGIDDPDVAIARLARTAIDSWLHGNRTGPVARGDAEIVRAHLESLDGDDKELYVRLAARLVEKLETDRSNRERLGHIKALLERYSQS